MNRSATHIVSVFLMLVMCIGACVAPDPPHSFWLFPLFWFVIELFGSLMTL